MKISVPTRRTFLRSATLATGGIILAPATMAAQVAKQIDATEELMREHGVLRRALLVYQHCLNRLRANQTKGLAKPLNDTAQLFRRFGEDYHERAIEEKYIFPVLLEGKSPVTRFPAILTAQHEQGRDVTTLVNNVTRTGNIPSGDVAGLIKALDAFILMYNHHANREDTEVFVAWKNTLSPERYQEMTQTFQDIAEKMIGVDGFEAGVKQIAAIESQLGIANLQQFTVRG
jgi:hemerythrin-like domain-containing protein